MTKYFLKDLDETPLSGALGWIRTNDHPIGLERMGSHHRLMGPSIKGLPTILLLYYSQDRSGAQTN